MERLELYAEALRKWNPKINLVSKSTLVDLWERHFADSAQLLQLAPDGSKEWADLGSGGGFPGLVIANLAADQHRHLSVTMVESYHRKSAFLRSVLRETSISAKVISSRIEEVPPLGAGVLSARALASLPKLLALAERHLAIDGAMLFPKGKNWQEELLEAQSTWRFEYDVAKSKTSDQSVILRISGVSRA